LFKIIQLPFPGNSLLNIWCKGKKVTIQETTNEKGKKKAKKKSSTHTHTHKRKR